MQCRGHENSRQRRAVSLIRGLSVVTIVTAAIFTVSACAYQWSDSVKNLFGPRPVTLHEAYQPQPAGPTFNHSLFDEMLKRHVDNDGWVDYEGWRNDASSLDAYITSLAGAPFDTLGRNQKLALLINAYNAFTVRLILDNYPVKSIKDIPSAKRWNAKRWPIGAMTLSLNQIEHEQIRPKFSEPRVHFALVCAAIGCPKLRNEAYQAERIDEQLTDQMRYAHSHDRWFQYDPGAKTIHLTSLYDWYGGDFKQVAGSVLNLAARYSSDLKAAIDAGKTPRIRWLKYDWTLNDGKNNR